AGLGQLPGPRQQIPASPCRSRPAAARHRSRRAPDAGYRGPCPRPATGHRAPLLLCARLVSAPSRSRGRAGLMNCGLGKMRMWRVKSLDAVLAGAQRKSLHRSLGPVHLTLLGIGGVIGTGIFVLTAEAAQKAGPGMMLSLIIAGAVSAVAALCYAELAAMVPVSGSAYAYSYIALGELMAWLVGLALVLEYAVAASAVSVGWSGYIVGLLAH